MFSGKTFKFRGAFWLSIVPRVGYSLEALKFGGLKGFDGAMEVLHGGVGELRREWRERRSMKAESARAEASRASWGSPWAGRRVRGDEGEDGGEFPQAAGVPAVLESVVVSFGCAGAGPAASSRHGRPPMVGEGYVGLWVGDGRVMEDPGRLRENGVYAGTDAWSSDLSGCSTLATTLRQPRTSEGTWRRSEEILAVGQSRPPEALDHPKGWERGPVTGCS